MSSHERAHQDEANNVTYQRCQYAYEFAKPLIAGKKILDVGCGLAYGTALMAESASAITGIDYDQETVNDNVKRYHSITNLEFKPHFSQKVDKEYKGDALLIKDPNQVEKLTETRNIKSPSPYQITFKIVNQVKEGFG